MERGEGSAEVGPIRQDPSLARAGRESGPRRQPHTHTHARATCPLPNRGASSGCACCRAACARGEGRGLVSRLTAAAAQGVTGPEARSPAASHLSARSEGPAREAAVQGTEVGGAQGPMRAQGDGSPRPRLCRSPCPPTGGGALSLSHAPPHTRPVNPRNSRELAMEISVTSLGSSQILRWPQFRTCERGGERGREERGREEGRRQSGERRELPASAAWGLWALPPLRAIGSGVALSDGLGVAGAGSCAGRGSPAGARRDGGCPPAGAQRQSLCALSAGHEPPIPPRAASGRGKG